MLENQERTKRIILATLMKEGCCERCCLRYIGVKDTTVYRDWNTVKTLVNDFLSNPEDGDNIPDAKKTKMSPCISCLDLLRETDDYKKICNDVITKGYDTKSFMCALYLPVSLQIREKSVLLFLSHRFPEVYSVGDSVDGYHHFISLKDVWKWTYGPRMSELLKMKLDNGLCKDLNVEVNVTYPDDEKESSCLLQMHATIFEPRAKHPRRFGGEVFTKKSVEAALQGTTYEHFQQYSPCPPETPAVAAQYGPTTCSHNSVFVAGRYNKFSRFLSQTPWVIDGERKAESSVQELICESIVSAAKAQGSKFSASGREDVDVRTLGKGRPFALELLDPHRAYIPQHELKIIQDEINKNSEGKIAIRDLQIVSKEELSELKHGEEGKGKRYIALCVALTPPAIGVLESLSEKVNELVLHQKTPIRVLHRRPLAERLRTIHKASAEVLPSTFDSDKRVYFLLRLRTQAGTYIKEFVHGDFGRTEPSLGSLLGVEVDILALDVEEVELDWPKEINSV